MGFIKKISDGDITIKDNEVVEKKQGALEEQDQEAAAQWAQEFSAHTVKALYNEL